MHFLSSFSGMNMSQRQSLFFGFLLTRDSRNQAGMGAFRSTPYKSPQPPIKKGERGGISEICYHFAYNFFGKGRSEIDGRFFH
jgi:hypothetical protein